MQKAMEHLEKNKMLKSHFLMLAGKVHWMLLED